MRDSKGFGLLELMLTLCIASLIMAVALPMYGGYVERAKVATAIDDIASASIEIDVFRLHNRDRVPLSLTELPKPMPNDPWGRPYVYRNIIDDQPNKDAVREYGKSNPLNTDYDLYSQGEDGNSEGPLAAKASRDDIVRANNGSFIGLGEDF